MSSCIDIKYIYYSLNTIRHVYQRAMRVLLKKKEEMLFGKLSQTTNKKKVVNKFVFCHTTMCDLVLTIF